MTKKYFITATGTGIGKTFITAGLVRQLRSNGKSVTALKPVISGFDPKEPEESDTGILLRAQDISITPENIEHISPWRFREAISPDMAADNERRPIPFSELLAFCRQERSTDYTLIEAVGGIMTPLTRDKTVFHWAAELGYDTILVAGTYLGAISHTLTAYEALTARKIRTHSIILSESELSPVPLKRIILTLRNFLPNNFPIYCITRSGHQQDLKHIAL